MGIIRAAVDTARGTLADQWLDVVEAGEMGEQTLFTEGVIVDRAPTGEETAM